jgi:hypothetical protein
LHSTRPLWRPLRDPRALMPERAIAEPLSSSTLHVWGGVGARSVDSEPAVPDADFRPPHPLSSAALLLAPLPLPLALWAAGVLPTPAALAFGVFLFVLALIQGGLGAFDLYRSRRLGDALLRAYSGQPPVSGLAAWRSSELTSPRNRRWLASHVRQLRRETRACARSDDSPADSAVLDENLVLLRRLEYRLEKLSDPVSPFGMLGVHELATDEFSPLYHPERASGLPADLSRALAALEPR